MTLHVQLFGGSSTDLRLYVGPSREIAVDTTNQDLLLQDGSTPGGIRFLNVNNANVMFQRKSNELDGFSFDTSGFGILVRKTPGNYALRTLQANSANITLQNGSGVNGNPTIALAATVTTSHTFTGAITFQSVIQGDLNGDTVGTHTGPVIGNVTGNVTGNLIGNVEGNTEGAHVGNVDVRGATLLLDDDQIDSDKINGLIALIKLYGTPAGGIIAWSGTPEAIPSGWFLCDGTNGTPDLRGKFLIGSNGTYPNLSTGGTTTHTPILSVSTDGAHTHTLSVAAHALTEAELPAHKHGNGVTCATSNVFNHSTTPASPTTGKSIDENGATGSTEGYTTTIGSGSAHGHAGSTADSNGDHTHTVTSNTINHIPPYYALCFIMKGS